MAAAATVAAGTAGAANWADELAVTGAQNVGLNSNAAHEAAVGSATGATGATAATSATGVIGGDMVMDGDVLDVRGCMRCGGVEVDNGAAVAAVAAGAAGAANWADELAVTGAQNVGLNSNAARDAAVGSATSTTAAPSATGIIGGDTVVVDRVRGGAWAFPAVSRSSSLGQYELAAAQRAARRARRKSGCQTFNSSVVGVILRSSA